MLKKLLLFIIIQMFVLFLVISAWIGFPKSDLFLQNYFLGVQDHIEHLKRLPKTKKIILLGGSSLGFSVSAYQLSQDLGVPVYNLGLHIAIGNRNIWNLYKNYLDPSTDLIVISPEYGSFLRLDGFYQEHCMVLFLLRDVQYLLRDPQCVPTIFRETFQEFKYFFLKRKHPRDIYFRDALNSFGDVVSHYELENRSIDGLKSEPHGIPHSALLGYIEFVDKEIVSKGFQVVYIPTIVPRSYCLGKEENIYRGQKFLVEAFHSQVSVSYSNLCFDDKLFFNTKYHMNKSGIRGKTKIFFDVINAHLNQ